MSESTENKNVNTIHLDIRMFKSTGPMMQYVQSLGSQLEAKNGPILIMHGSRIYYLIDNDGPHSIPEIPSKLIVKLFGLDGLTNNETVAKVVQYHDPSAEIYVTVTYE